MFILKSLNIIKKSETLIEAPKCDRNRVRESFKIYTVHIFFAVDKGW